jgi:hypothetical protein
MAKPPPPECPRSRAAALSHPGGWARGGDGTRRPAAAGVVNLTQVERGWESGVRGSGAPGRGDSLGAGKRCPTACSCPCDLVSPCPALPAAVTRAPGSGEQRRLQVGALPAGSERAPRSALYKPRPGRAGGGIGPPSARPSPPPGAPRPRPSLQPPARPPAVRRAARGSPSHMAVAAASNPLRTSLRGTRPLPWVVPPAPAGSRALGSRSHTPLAVRSPLFPVSPLSLARELRTAPPAIRRCGRQPCRLTG